MVRARNALRQLYANTLKRNVIKSTLDEMRSRGLPKELYNKYLEEAIAIGLIPVPGKSIVGGRVLTEKDILTDADILANIPEGFKNNYAWYGVN